MGALDLLGRHSDPREPDPDAEAARERLAVRQLERVEDYLVATLNLELADPAIRRRLNLIRGDVLALRSDLVRPRPYEW
ncbi:MAG: hypothetical protein M3024_09115 [Candidatus Dormibacteraeota bacterium]|nr:hypothetical protein [Candidatus Dormibacteraeota bacterium]